MIPELGDPPGSICVLRLSAVGDVCNTLPVVRTLQAAWPDTRITWVIGRLEASLLGDIAGIEFVPYDKHGGLKAWRALRRSLRGRRFDALLHMQVSMRASLASLAISTDLRLGFDYPRSSNLQWLFTNRRIPARSRQHVVDTLFGFAEALGVRERRLCWDIPIPETDRAFARERLADDRPVLVISPCSSARFRNWRNWPAQRYAAVARHALDALGMQVVLTGGPSGLEREYGEAVQSGCGGRALNLVGATSLKQLLAVLEGATALISPDSGPVHMANAVGTPVIGLYATSNPDRTGPYVDRRWLVNAYPENLRRYNDKSIASARWGERVRDPRAMEAISAGAVTERLEALLRELSGQARTVEHDTRGSA